jgi:putative FmdB family regulatory protein
VPTYAYACTACGHEFDAVQSFSDDALSDCPQCAGRLRKKFGAVGVVFKGSGFYRTDSRNGSSGAVGAGVNGGSNGSSNGGSSESGSSGTAAATSGDSGSSSGSTGTSGSLGSSGSGSSGTSTATKSGTSAA